MLTLEHIQKTYGTGDTATTVLKDINLSVNDGELICLYGPSGSGKSTLLSIIGALLTPTDGTISMNGERRTEENLTELRLNKIGFIFQSAHLLSYLTVKEQLIFVGTEAGMTKKEAQQKAIALLAEFGLSHRLNHYPKSLSGGEKQRTAIARAFMNDPALILADEPTASLDQERAVQVVDILQQRVKQSGTSCILITHDERIFKYADQLYLLNNGTLIQQNMQ